MAMFTELHTATKLAGRYIMATTVIILITYESRCDLLTKVIMSSLSAFAATAISRMTVLVLSRASLLFARESKVLRFKI